MLFRSQQLNEYRVFTRFNVTVRVRSTPSVPFFSFFPRSFLFPIPVLVFCTVLARDRAFIGKPQQIFSLRANNSIWRGQFSGNLVGCKFS